MLSKLFVKCPQCGTTHFISFYRFAHYVCSRCGHHLRLDARTRVKKLCDGGSFHELEAGVGSVDPLGFPGYAAKLDEARRQTGLDEAVLCGVGRIGGLPAAIAILEPGFIMASMGSAVGEKVTRLLEHAAAHRLPAVVVVTSGGARMQEGILSLMQMAKTAAAVRRLHEAGRPLFTVLADPTTGGVTASFAMLGDVIIGETGALIGFAGPRVIQQTIGQRLPDGFQTAEFLLEHGMLDLVVERRQLKPVLTTLLQAHHRRPYAAAEA